MDRLTARELEYGPVSRPIFVSSKSPLGFSHHEPFQAISELNEKQKDMQRNLEPDALILSSKSLILHLFAQLFVFVCVLLLFLFPSQI